MKAITIIGVLILAPLIFACRAPMREPSAQLPDRDAIVLAVLAHMVTNADDSGRLVRFVDLPPTHLKRLRTISTGRFQIFSTDQSDSSGDVLHLKDSNREGVMLVAEVSHLGVQSAEAGGSYQHVGSVIGFCYKLRHDKGRWRISSCEFGGCALSQ